jgi:serine/threonine-protein kinase
VEEWMRAQSSESSKGERMKSCPQCSTGYPDSLAACPTHGVPLNEIRELKPGMVVHHSYRIVRKLGQGGMGAVYLAQHTLMDEPRALKFLSPELSSDQAFTGRFLREVRTLRHVRNRNVVDCGDLERAEDDSLFFSMEFVDGPDLRRFLHDAPRPFDVPLALEITRGIAEGLGAAHLKGMVHRDIKPENILMAREGGAWVPKIADFGIVATKESSSVYTRTGGTLLTMTYAAPEQWRGTPAAELDGRTDLYALGGVLYEMLTGQTVLHAENYEGWAWQHQNAAPQPPSALRPELANWQGLDALVLRLLAKDREDRPKDVAELVELLDAVRCFPHETHRTTVCEDVAAGPIQRPTKGISSPATSADMGNSASDQPWNILWVVSVVLGILILFYAVFFLFESTQPSVLPDSAVQTQPVVQPQPEHTANLNPPDSMSSKTWTDPATGLMWTKKDNGSDVNWQQAIDYCRNLQLAGHSSWRLATIDELQGIYDPNANVGGYHVKGNLQLSNWWVWSSSPGNASDGGWGFGFEGGERTSYILGYSGYVKRALCVRRPGG